MTSNKKLGRILFLLFQKGENTPNKKYKINMTSIVIVCSQKYFKNIYLFSPMLSLSLLFSLHVEGLHKQSGEKILATHSESKMRDII
jgi:hypothetical protein